MAREVRSAGGTVPGAVAAAVARLDTLEDVLHWGGDVVDIVVQDELTHDVIVRGAGAYLVFDTT